MGGLKHKHYIAALRLKNTCLSTWVVNPSSLCQQEMFPFDLMSVDQLILLSVDLIMEYTYNNDFWV